MQSVNKLFATMVQKVKILYTEQLLIKYNSFFTKEAVIFDK